MTTTETESRGRTKILSVQREGRCGAEKKMTTFVMQSWFCGGQTNLKDTENFTYNVCESFWTVKITETSTQYKPYSTNTQEIHLVWLCLRQFKVFFLFSAEQKHPRECFLSPLVVLKFQRGPRQKRKRTKCTKEAKTKTLLGWSPCSPEESYWNNLELASVDAGWFSTLQDAEDAQRNVMMTAIKKRCRSQLAGQGTHGRQAWIPEVKGIL